MAAFALAVLGCTSTAPRFRAEAADEREDAAGRDVREEARRVDVKSFAPKVLPRRPPRPSDSNRDSIEESLPAGLNRDKVLLDIVKFLGVPYHYGHDGDDGTDCSGFTARIYESAVGVQLPRSTTGQYHEGVRVKRHELRFGDLVFFNTTGRRPSHVGIYIEDDLFVHASVNFGVTISSMESTYYKDRFVGARRIIE